MQITMCLLPQQLMTIVGSEHNFKEQSLAILLKTMGQLLQKRNETSLQVTGPEFKLNALNASGLFKGLPIQWHSTGCDQQPLVLESGQHSLCLDLLFDQFGWMFHCAPLTLPLDCEFALQYRKGLFGEMPDMPQFFRTLQQQFIALPQILSQLLQLWLQQDKRQLVIFGTGAAARSIQQLGIFAGLQSAWSDNNQQLHGQHLAELPVLAPAALDPKLHFVLILSSYFPAISAQLQQAGWQVGRDHLDGFALYTVLPAITQNRLDPRLQEALPYVF